MRRHTALSLSAFCVLLQGCVVVPVPLPPRAHESGSTVALAPVPLTKGCSRPAAADAMQAQVMAEINAFRAENGLKALKTSALLASVAQSHACDNAARGSISHDGSDGATLSDRLHRSGYRLWTAAENTGLGFVDAPGRMVAFWKNSPPHRANLLNANVTEAGLGFTGGAKPAWVLDLAQPR